MDATWNDCGGWLAGHTNREAVVVDLSKRWGFDDGVAVVARNRT